VWRIGDDLPLGYRCHTGHAFSALLLGREQRSGAENAFWSRYDACRRGCCWQKNRSSLTNAAGSPGVSGLRVQQRRLQAAIEGNQATGARPGNSDAGNTGSTIRNGSHVRSASTEGRLPCSE
jgi:hypothetical protein